MKRVMRILSLVALSSGYVMAGQCVMSGDGFSFFNTIPVKSIPIFGTYL